MPLAPLASSTAKPTQTIANTLRHTARIVRSLATCHKNAQRDFLMGNAVYSAALAKFHISVLAVGCAASCIAEQCIASRNRFLSGHHTTFQNRGSISRLAPKHTLVVECQRMQSVSARTNFPIMISMLQH